MTRVVGTLVPGFAARLAFAYATAPREPPEALVLRLRRPKGKPLRTTGINGKGTRGFDPARKTVSLKAGRGAPISVRALY